MLGLSTQSTAMWLIRRVASRVVVDQEGVLNTKIDTKPVLNLYCMCFTVNVGLIEEQISFDD